MNSGDVFAVSAVAGGISHLDQPLQRETKGPTSLYCLFNKRDKVTDNLSRPASKRLMNSEGTNKNQERRRVSHCSPKVSRVLSSFSLREEYAVTYHLMY